MKNNPSYLKNNILFFCPFNNRSRDNESLILKFREMGHTVLFLTMGDGNRIIQFLEGRGISCSKMGIRVNGYWGIIKQISFLIKFIKKHKIDIVYSHLEPANFITVFAQYFVSAKTFIVRHHINEGRLYGFDKSLSYKLTYSLAKKIIVVSEHAKQYMIQHENIPAQKIIYIPLVYDCNLYDTPNKQNVVLIKKKYSAEILLLTVGRFTKFKRLDLSIEIAETLNKTGIKTKLLILGQGELLHSIQETINKKCLQEIVFLPGYVDNIIDYMSAADFLIHPSISESSCVSIKEASLAELPVIVCEGVGDFNTYIINEKNGFIINRDKFVEESVSIIRKLFTDNTISTTIVLNLKKTIHERFNINKIYPIYEKMHNPGIN